ncbi:hypothetical protein ABLE68_19915 [Nocardioides sp. CN2-186]|uniref:hypothetical protein n=1 Tax=Nocardioides tweenelious TaxID=3156607 RepID=UPI0032B602EF
MFDAVNYTIAPAARDGIELGSLSSSEVNFVATAGLKQLARVLVEAERVGSQDLDAMWRSWAGLSGSRRLREEGQLGSVRLQLTIVVVAYLLSRLGAEEWSEQSLALTRRLSSRPPDPGALSAIAEMMQDEGSAAEELWDELVRDSLPERRVAFVEGLRTALVRLLAFWTAIGDRSQTYVGDWIADSDDQELTHAVADVRLILSRADLAAIGDDPIVERLKGLRDRARRIVAERILAAPISEKKLARIAIALGERWKEARDLPTLLDLAGARREAGPATTALELSAGRGFLVDGTNYVGEDEIGRAAADNLIRLETEAVLNDWLASAVRVVDGSLLEHLSEHGWKTMICSIDWAADRWREENLAHRSIPAVYTSTQMQDGFVLLVDAAPQLWRVAPVDPPPLLNVRDRPLGDEATDVYVTISVELATPAAEGSARAALLRAPWA